MQNKTVEMENKAMNEVVSPGEKRRCPLKK